MNFVLERHKFFPYVAWTVVIGFVIFTYSLTIQLSESTQTLEAQAQVTASATRE